MTEPATTALSVGKEFVAPLADAYERIDPARDGWESEAFSEDLAEPLSTLKHLLEGSGAVEEGEGSGLLAEDFHLGALRPELLEAVFADTGFEVRRAPASRSGGRGSPADLRRFGDRVREWYEAAGIGGEVHAKLKLYRVELASAGGDDSSHDAETAVLATVWSEGADGRVQANAEWTCRWARAAGDGPPRLAGLEVRTYEEVATRAGAGGGGVPLLVDATASVLTEEAGPVVDQFSFGTDHWRGRIPSALGLDVVANHGLAVGDIDGDGLEDLYVCQQGGLPNRLLMRNPDGTLRDFTAESGTGWLDYCASALIVDLDNDGDRDLVVSQDFRVLVMDNLDGKGRFELAFGSGTKAQTYSMAAADFDGDGFIDLYLCGYNPSAAGARSGAMGEPLPFHDANNGGPNLLWRNDGAWGFEDVTEATGLDANNRRFSFAASWEDFDNDGDLDLYVANDYGRNNLYRNEGAAPGGLPRFVDVAGELDVEDTSAGMSTSWADFNRDGWMDLYVSNMFSGAGNRITYQRQFQTGEDEAVRAQFQRMARGNTLYASDGAGGFRDVSVTAGVTMGRWAWGSRFVDLNNDGWEDLLVANGFITAEDPGDL